MKRAFKSMLGVTLLEIMLVLAVAAFILVMSIRYYQAAQTNTSVQEVEGAITSIDAAASNIALATGSYSTVTASNIAAAGLPGGVLSTAWGTLNTTTITFTGTATGYTAALTFTNLPTTAVCPQIKGYISNSFKGHLTGTPTCTATSVGWVYTR